MNKRFITLKDNVVIAIRYGEEQLDNEILSNTGELGQIMQLDGTFLTPEIEHIAVATLEEQIYAENLFQTALLEIQMLGGI